MADDVCTCDWSDEPVMCGDCGKYLQPPAPGTVTVRADDLRAALDLIHDSDDSYICTACRARKRLRAALDPEEK